MTETTVTDHPPPGAGGSLLFSRYGALAMLGIAGVAAWQGFELPVFLAGIILALTAVTRGWSKAALLRLDYSRRLKTTRAFPGDQITCEAELDNRKLLPLVWVNVSEPVAAGIAPDTETLRPGMQLSNGRISVDTSLMWYQRAKWSYRLRCRRRGYYRIGPAEVTSSDVFGIFRRSGPAAQTEYLAVYPRVYPLRELGLPSNFPLGGVRSLNPLLQDPTRVRGIRDYSPDVPFRHIHWKASARTGHLQAKVFDPTCSLQLSLLLDVTGPARTASDGNDSDLELAISATASLAWHHSVRHGAVGLFANTRLADGAHSIAVRPSSGRRHLADILLALAKAKPETVPFPKLLDAVRPGLVSGGTLVVITGGLDRDSESRLAELRARGFPVTVFLVGAGTANTRQFPVQRIVRPADFSRPV